MLCLDMGLGKTRPALLAAQQLFAAKKIDRLIVLAPAAVRLILAARNRQARSRRLAIHAVHLRPEETDYVRCEESSCSS